MTGLSKRLHAYRDDLADIRLKGQVEAARYVEGRPAQIAVPLCSVQRAPAADAMQVTQALLGETLKVFDSAHGWSWVQLDGDGYVGYVRDEALADHVTVPSHRVAVPSTFRFPQADLKSVPATSIFLNSRIALQGESNGYGAMAGGGHVFSHHCAPLGQNAGDFVAVAEQFLHTPYLWGGKSVHGIDCSGLAQLALQAAGIAAPRDSDMQEEATGERLPDGTPLKRGDLVFWKGHVGIMQDAHTLLHATGHFLMVVSEPFAVAVERIAGRGSPVTCVRRVQ